MARITIDIPDDLRDSDFERWSDDAPAMDDATPIVECDDGNDNGNRIDAATLPGQSPLELAALAAREYADGRDREWAGALLAALQKTFLHLGKANGIASDNILDISRELDEKDDSGRILYYGGKVGSVGMLEYHHRTGAVPDYWHEPLYRHVVAFVKECYDSKS